MNKRLRFIKATQLSDTIDREPPKTKIWTVRNVETRINLGDVRWFGRWRQYAFDPGDGLSFEKTCLRTIADFCERKTRQHYRGLKGCGWVSTATSRPLSRGLKVGCPICQGDARFIGAAASTEAQDNE